MIPLYILGLLLRFGPQHGYQIKKLMEEQLEDFTQIKLPTVYYHLEKMEAAGLITAHRDRQGARPEKTVYRVSDGGTAKFGELLIGTLNFQYRPHFEADAAFFFSDYLDHGDILESLGRHADSLKRTLSVTEQHRDETMKYIPEEFKAAAGIIFEHHLMHYRAELAWAEQSMESLKEAKTYDESKSN